nr:carboxypeptidase regulatory-like domain-containing protein [uncultured Desulfobacter sp.]
MVNWIKKNGLIFLLMCFMVFWSMPAWAITISGSITLSEVSGEGNVYLGVFDPENGGPGNKMACAMIHYSSFDTSGETASGTYSMELTGDNLPEKVLLFAFYDRNNSCNPLDSLTDWPDYGDLIGAPQTLPITIGNSDITIEPFAVDKAYESSTILQTYDDFSDASGKFLTEKWNGVWNALEYVRQVKNGVLVSGFRSSNARERNRLLMTHTGAVSSLKADVKITEELDSGTDQNNSVFARLEANLYNAVSATPDSSTGNIWTGVYLGKRQGQEGFWYFIDQCVGENQWETFGFGAIPVSGDIALDTWYGLEIAYNKENNQITYRVIDSAGNEIGSVTHTELPAYQGDCLDSYPNLTTGSGRYSDKMELCSISAEFDNVEINGALYDDFNADELNPAKWRSTETVRVIEGTDAVLLAESKGDKETNNLLFSRKISHAYADMTIEESSFATYGRAKARLVGYLYNDTYSGLDEYDEYDGEAYNGEQGVVCAQVFIDLKKDEDGNEYLDAAYYMERANEAEPEDDEDYTLLAEGSLSGLSLAKGKTYRLGLNFTGTQVIFSCKDLETGDEAGHTYAISTPAYPLQDNYFSVTARGYNYDEDSSGSVGNRILVKVSQVYTGTPADQDGDTLSDFDELRLMYNPADGDMDDDGIMDGNEDLDADGIVGWLETDPRNWDTDNDGISDGTEIGLATAQLPADADGFIADMDPTSTTNPLNWDTDGDGLSDGQEDTNANGRVDEGESDPGDAASGQPETENFYGTVRQSQTGEVCSDATVEILDPDGYGIVYTAVTNDLGEYIAYVEPGRYMIRAYAPGLARTFYFYDEDSGVAGGVYPSSEATVVEIQSDENQNIDFSLDVGGSISGTIYETDGTTPIANASVIVRPGKYIFDCGFTVLTDAQGHYAVDCLALGQYKVKAQADGFAQMKYYNGIYGWYNAENVIVQPPIETENIDITLEPEATISGYVRAADTSEPLEFGVITGTVSGAFEGIGTTSDINNNGEYTIKGLPPGSYTIQLDSLNADNYYVCEYYDNAHFSDSASTVTVQAGDHVGNINFDLETGGKIRGRVVDDETGNPIKEVQIGASNTSGKNLPSTPVVDSEGYFSLNALPGSYILNVFECHGYISEYYQDAYTFETAKAIDVQAGTETPLIEFRLNQGGAIEGLVYADGDLLSPLAVTTLYAFPVDRPDLPGSGTISNADGTYRIEGLATGKYVVKAVTNGYAMQCRTADVTMPDTTYGIDLDLPSYPYSVDTKVESVIGTAGGVVSAGSDISGFNFVGVELPSGSLCDDTLISISELVSEPVPMPQALVGINIPIHLGPEGTQFLNPAILQIAYTDDDLSSAGILDASYLDVFTLNTETLEWAKVLGNKTVDYTNKRIEIELEHFSIYQLGYSTADTGDLDMDLDLDGRDLYKYILQAASGESIFTLKDLADHFGSTKQ